jgi:hypothetical protein
MLNPTLSDLVGGIQSVTLGDDEARRRGTQKSILERKAPPTFDVIVEIQSWQRVALHANVAETVDALLRGFAAPPEVRQLGRGGRIEIVDDEDASEGPRRIDRGSGANTWELGHHQNRRGGGHIREERAAAPAGLVSLAPAGSQNGGPRVVALYPFGVSRSRLEQASRSSGVEVRLVDDLHEAEAVVTLRAYYRSKPPPIREAEERSLPIYVVKSNTVFQLEQVLLQFRPGRSASRGDPMVEVLKEAEDAVARVIEDGRPVELAPANSYVRRVQHEIAGRYNLESQSSGKEPNRRVKILPEGGAGQGFSRS